MSDPVVLMLALIAGAVIGVAYFAALWWTVRRGCTSLHPALWFMSSLLLRMSFALGGILLVADGHWQRLLACLLGFILGRLAVMAVFRPAVPHQQDACRAPQS